MARVFKTEHNGAKNGGGYWGGRAEAKEVSSSRRRAISKEIIIDALTDATTPAPELAPDPPAQN